MFSPLQFRSQPLCLASTNTEVTTYSIALIFEWSDLLLLSYIDNFVWAIRVCTVGLCSSFEKVDKKYLRAINVDVH